MVRELQTCVLVFVPEQGAALLEGFFTDVAGVQSFFRLLQSLPTWSPFPFRPFVH